MKIKEIKIARDSPGRSYHLTRFKIYPDDRAIQRIFIQDNLHACEQPGTLIPHHLMTMLKIADKSDLLAVLFVIFSMVNPIGMMQFFLHYHLGRYNLPPGINFNRAGLIFFDTVTEL